MNINRVLCADCYEWKELADFPKNQAIIIVLIVVLC